MNNKLIIRKETKEDYKNTELVTMRSFWNLYEPGCRETSCAEKNERG